MKLDLIPPASCESAITSFKDLVHKLSSKSYFQYKHKNGTIRWWAINAVKLSENRFLGFAKDITLRMETEESLRLHHFELEMQNDELIKANKEAMDLSEKYSELYEFAPSGYFTLSTENKIQELNHCGAIILGNEKSNLIGSPFDFFVSIDKKNMEHFRGTVSQLWQKHHTTEQLNQAFKAIIDSGANWAALEDFEPILAAESTVDKDGVLALTGYYPTKPSQVHFEQKYIYEGVSWKLVEFNIEAK